jgi:hypothetical protein
MKIRKKIYMECNFFHSEALDNTHFIIDNFIEICMLQKNINQNKSKISSEAKTLKPKLRFMSLYDAKYLINLLILMKYSEFNPSSNFLILSLDTVIILQLLVLLYPVFIYYHTYLHFLIFLTQYLLYIFLIRKGLNLQVYLVHALMYNLLF